jgi:hypothetical protein
MADPLATSRVGGGAVATAASAARTDPARRRRINVIELPQQPRQRPRHPQLQRERLVDSTGKAYVRVRIPGTRSYFESNPEVPGGWERTTMPRPTKRRLPAPAKPALGRGPGGTGRSATATAVKRRLPVPPKR